MTDSAEKPKILPQPARLRWEITAALSVKVLLLIGLWFLIFRWMDRSTAKPDIASHFSLPAAQTAAPDFSSQPVKESSHVR